MAETPAYDPITFHTFERAGWERTAADYHRHFQNLTTLFIPALLEAADLGPQMRVLDIATGPGYVAAAAAERGAKVVGVDFSSSMVAQARQQFPAITFQQGDAEALPFPDSSFDAVLISFGLLHFARPEQALAEARRVLRPGGRVAFSVWARPEEAVGFGIILRAIEAYGKLDVPLPPGPPFFRFSDPAETRRVLLATGFAAPATVRVSCQWVIADGDTLLETFLRGSVRTGALLQAQTPAALAAIRGAVRAATHAYAHSGSIHLPIAAIVASAARPK
jgi:SAM-dependent methyltransferase